MPVTAFEPDERQRQAIEHVRGPLLVIAGAGTGKTTVLIRRIAHLVRENHIPPNQILALTYTDNAAKDMRDRVQSELGGNVAGLQVATFHAYCNNLLIRCGKQFDLLDDKDLWIYLRKRIHELHLTHYVRAANVSKFLEDLLDFMRRCQDELVSPERYAEYVRRLEQGGFSVHRVSKSKDAEVLTDDEVLERCREIAHVFTTVEAKLLKAKLGSFGHMITRAHDLLQQDSDLLARERESARFILVDEFQDANFAQVKILQKLAGEDRNIFAVGDPDQAIYRFRGASSAAFGLFQRHFPGAKLVALEKNRRSTTPILRSAFAVISKNPDVFADAKAPLAYRRSPLLSARDEDAAKQGREVPNAPVETVILAAKEGECSDVAAGIRQRQRQTRCDWSDFAVLYRQHIHRDAVAAELAEQGIPFSIENMDVLDTPQVRDLLACLGAVISQADDASVFRVAALPQFAIDPVKLRAGIRALPRDAKGASVAAVLAGMEGGAAVLESLQEARDEIVRTKALSTAALQIITRRFGFDPKSAPLLAFSEFVSKWEEKPVTETREIAEFLEYLDYFREAKGVIPLPSREENAVRLMSAHSAKGLEFNHTFILRAVSPSFPSSYKEPLVEFPGELSDQDSATPTHPKDLHTQEERRLFYVAMTRARDSLTIYAPQGKGKDPTPPGYLRELLKDATLSRWLRQRPAAGFQTDLFGAAATSVPGSRSNEWLSLPPASDLSARLSATAVQTYQTCPLQFKLEREWRIPREVPAAMQYGATMHRVLRTYYESIRLERPMTDDAVIELFRADLAAANIPDRYQHQLYENQGLEQLREFLAAARRNPVPEVIHLEELFEVRIARTTIAGRIDRIDKVHDGQVVISDYKTGKPQSQEDADESLQLSIYALGAREKWGYQAHHLVFYNLKDNNTVVTCRTDLQLQDARQKVEGVAASIAAGRFEAKPGFYCNFCSYRNLCPATEKRLFTISAGKPDKSPRREPKNGSRKPSLPPTI